MKNSIFTKDFISGYVIGLSMEKTTSEILNLMVSTFQMKEKCNVSTILEVCVINHLFRNTRLKAVNLTNITSTVFELTNKEANGIKQFDIVKIDNNNFAVVLDVFEGNEIRTDLEGVINADRATIATIDEILDSLVNNPNQISLINVIKSLYE